MGEQRRQLQAKLDAELGQARMGQEEQDKGLEEKLELERRLAELQSQPAGNVCDSEEYEKLQQEKEACNHELEQVRQAQEQKKREWEMLQKENEAKQQELLTLQQEQERQAEEQKQALQEVERLRQEKEAEAQRLDS